MLKKELLDIMACPFCKSNIRLEGDWLICTNQECLCRYRIEDDIPIMLIDEAKRPCPKCSSQRDWLEEKNTLRCSKCGCSFST